RGECVTCRETNQLGTPHRKEGFSADKDCIGPLARQRFKHSVDFAASAGGVELNLQTHGAGRRLGVFRRGFCGGAERIDEDGHATSAGFKLVEELKTLCDQLTVEKIDSREVAARSG